MWTMCTEAWHDIVLFHKKNFMASRKEMVSLVSATQNEVAKAAMDAWATILQARRRHED